MAFSSINKNSEDPISSASPKSKPTVFSQLSFGWFVLLLGLGVTALTSVHMKSRVEEIASQEFVDQCNKIQMEIADRLDDHERILLSGLALFKTAVGGVSREQWHMFTRTQDVDKQLPGILGIGYSTLIPSRQLSQHIETVRRQGFPDYKVSPEGERDLYSSIIYLEPFTARNQRAFGYDMFSEPVRRDAMSRARDTNKPALSGKVLLVQETDTGVQAGNLMYIPLYQNDLPIDTVEQRRVAISGWVYSPYRMNDLIQGILGAKWDETKRPFLEIFDGEEPSSQNLLYRDTQDESQQNLEHEHSFQLLVDFYGHKWTLRFFKSENGYASVEYLRVWLTLFGGLLITVLLFLLVSTLQKAKAQALQKVEIRTLELRESEKNFSSIVETLPIAIYVSTGPEQNGTYLNPVFTEWFGYTLEDVPSINQWLPLAYPDEAYRSQLTEEWTRRVRQAIETHSQIEPMETEVTCKEGSKKFIAWGYSSGGNSNYAFGIDLTERKLASERLKEAHDQLEARVEKRTVDLRNANLELENAQKGLLSQQEELRSLSSKLSLAEEQERRQIAEELHDNLGQTLALTKLRLGLLQSEALSDGSRESLKEIEATLASAIHYTRSLTVEVSPPGLYDLNFLDAVEWLGENILEKNGLAVEIIDDGYPKPLTEEARILLYKAIRELIVNVVKHAQATSVKITLEKQANQIIIVIEDDGVGFSDHSSLSKDHQGFGLFSIRERLTYLKGTVEIISEGKGGHVRLLAPLDPSVSDDLAVN